MTTRTVDKSRAQALARRIARLDSDPARREAVALGLLDAALAADEEALAAAQGLSGGVLDLLIVAVCARHRLERP